jgi:tripartite-type tricarboxylate transporter receptor subunit TctC
VCSGFNAQAQSWPSKPISLIVPFASGGTTDVLARAVGQELSVALGQPVVIESKPGAGATLGADYVAKAKPDGYVLLMGAVHHTIATSVYKKLPYDFQKDLAPISVVAMVPNVLVINTATPAKNVSELMATALHSTSLALSSKAWEALNFCMYLTKAVVHSPQTC